MRFCFSIILLVIFPAVAHSAEKLRICKPGEHNTNSKTCIVDGDTLWLNGINYRLKDFDTPEPQTKICGGAKEIELAHKATKRLQDLLNQNEWKIESFGKETTGDRILATIRINGKDVGDILIQEKLARKWPDGEEWWCSK